MSKFTPGPWQADSVFCDDDRALRVAMPHRNGMPTASIAYCQSNWRDSDAFERRISFIEAQANARLIAVAPELFAAVLQYRDDLRHPLTPDSIERRLAMIEALLAKVDAS
jgi:hypothetical protein